MKPYTSRVTWGKFTSSRGDTGFVGKPPEGIVDKTWHLKTRKLSKLIVRNANRSLHKSARQASVKDIETQLEDELGS